VPGRDLQQQHLAKHVRGVEQSQEGEDHAEVAPQKHAHEPSTHHHHAALQQEHGGQIYATTFTRVSRTVVKDLIHAVSYSRK
jgi:hypothetical protein